MMRKLPLVVAFILPLCLFILSAALASENTHVPDSISFAYCRDCMPFSFQGESNKPEGILIDYWNLWSKKTGVHVNFVPAQWNETLTMTREGTVDAHAGVFFSKTRDQYLQYGSPLLQSEAHLFFKQSLHITDNADATPYRIGVLSGDYLESYLKEMYPELALASYPDYNSLMADLENGRLLTFAADTSIGLYQLKKHGLASLFRYKENHPLYKKNFFVAVQEGKQDVLDIINEGISQITLKEKRDLTKHWIATSKGRDPNALVIAIDKNYPPFSLLDPMGKPSGLLVDIWRAWSKTTGKPVDFLPMSGTEIMYAVRSEEADIHSGMYRKADKEKNLFLCKPLYSVDTAVYRRSEDAPFTLKNASGKRIAVVDGSYQKAYLRQNFPNILLVSRPDTESALFTLLKGGADALVIEVPTVEALLDRMNLQGAVTKNDPILFTDTLHAGIAKNRPELLTQIDQGLNKIPPLELAGIDARWMQDEKQRFYKAPKSSLVLTPEENAWLTEHPVIHIGAMSAWPPMDFINQSGAPDGIGADLVNALNERLNNALKIVSAPFNENVEKVSDKQLDALLDITPTKEREQFFEFTRPYMTIPHVIIAPKDGPYFNTEADLANKTLALEKGFYSVKYFQNKYPQIKIKEYPDTAIALGAVARGEADAYAGNRAVAAWIMERELMSSLEIQGRIDRPGSILAIGIRKDWPLLASILDKALAALPRTDVREILQKWTDRGAENQQITLSDKERAFIESHSALLFSEIQWAPLFVIQNSGLFTGMIADYLQLITDKSGLTFKFVKSQNWIDVLHKYINGKIDMIPALGEKDEVSKDVLLTKPYMTFPLVIVTQNNINYIDKTAELNGHKVGVGRGYTSAHYLSENYPDIKLAETDSIDDGLLSLSKGETYAFVGHMAVVVDAMQRLGLKNLKIAGETKYRFEHKIGVTPKYPEAISIINKVIDSLTEAQLRAISREWLEVEYAKGIDYSLVWKVSAGAVLFILLILFWNQRLSREITKRKQAEMEIAANEKKIRAMSDASHDAVIMVNALGQVKFWNSAAEKMFDFKAEEVMNKDMHTLFVPDELHENILLELKRFAQNGRGPIVDTLVESKGLKRDGTAFPVEIAISSFQIDDDWYAVGAVRDITERKKAEAELRDAEERSRLVLDSAAEGIFGVDEKGGILFINTAACDMLNICDADNTGKNVHELVHHKKEDGSPYPIEECPMHKSFTQGEVYLIDDEVLWRPDGTSFPVQYSSSPILKDERLVGAVVTFRDVTERKIAEEQIRKLSNAVEQSPVWVIITDTKGTIEYVNAWFTQITGFTADEVMGLNPRVLSSGQTPAELYNDMWETIHKGDTWQGDLLNKRKNGELFWARIFISSVRDERDTITHFIGIGEDVTEKKALQQERDEAFDVISSSINYATNIQGSILPPAERLESILTEHFVLWEPRDRVGGDIYFCKPWGLGKIIALGDCTGHGVPGAFMTLITNGALEMALLETPPGDVNRLLQRTHQIIQNSLGQDREGGDSDDGLEMGICYIAPRNKKMIFAGARFSLFYLKDGEICEIKGDKKGIGYRSVPHNVEYTNHDAPLDGTGPFYMTTDGFIDQVGGIKRRSFGKKRFKTLLLELETIPVDNRGNTLLEALIEYQGSERRRDDVAVIGFNIK